VREELLSLLGNLVAFRSVDGRPEEKQKVARFVVQWLEERGVPVTYFPHETAPSLIADIPGNGDPVLLLTHLDVVPATDAMFVMKIDDDKCYGRGVLDDKISATIVMLLLAELMAWEKRPPIRAAFTTDEEIGSKDGVEKLLKEAKFGTVAAVIALDGGSEKNVVVRGKGIVHCVLTATGKTSHNSMPWKGDNAIEKVWRIYDRIRKQIGTEEHDDPSHWHETVSIGKIAGGEFINQVPADARAEIDIRFTEKYSVASVSAIIDESLEEGVTVHMYGTGECFGSDPGHPLVTTYLAAMKQRGIDATTGSEHGATDARFFVDMGVPILLHDPDGGGYHTDDEWLDVPSAVRVLDGLKEFCRSISR